jgi:hypothetical protein
LTPGATLGLTPGVPFGLQFAVPFADALTPPPAIGEPGGWHPADETVVPEVQSRAFELPAVLNAAP